MLMQDLMQSTFSFLENLQQMYFVNIGKKKKRENLCFLTFTPVKVLNQYLLPVYFNYLSIHTFYFSTDSFRLLLPPLLFAHFISFIRSSDEQQNREPFEVQRKM